jgi:glucose uptake protein GlcU
MLYSIALASHLFAAAVTGVVILFASFAMVRSKREWYRSSALSLGVVAAFEVVSGVVLTVLSTTFTAQDLSSHMALYLGVCLAVETFLYIRTQEVWNHASFA